MKTYAELLRPRRLYQHVGAQHLLPALDFRRLPGVVHAQARNHRWTPAGRRRLCSGSILQFTAREDFYENDIPSLGFYGHREFAIQNYSCPASPFIMFLPFICLALPEDSPFWTAKENDGMWDGTRKGSKRTVLEKPGHGSGQPRQQRRFGDRLRQGV